MNNIIISKGLAITINIICFCFVVSKSIECFVKYSKAPKGTNIGVEYTGHQNIFPIVTICGISPKVDDKTKRWNLTHLHRCGIDEYAIYFLSFFPRNLFCYYLNSYEDYQMRGKWFSKNCTDPKSLFEHVVARPDQLMKSIRFSYFGKTERDEIRKFRYSSQILALVDNSVFGRCIQITPTIEMIRFGIRLLELKFHATVRPRILLYSLGDWKTSRSATASIEPSGLRADLRVDLEHKVFNLLDIDGGLCNTGK